MVNREVYGLKCLQKSGRNLKLYGHSFQLLNAWYVYLHVAGDIRLSSSVGQSESEL